MVRSSGGAAASWSMRRRRRVVGVSKPWIGAATESEPGVMGILRRLQPTVRGCWLVPCEGLRIAFSGPKQGSAKRPSPPHNGFGPDRRAGPSPAIAPDAFRRSVAGAPPPGTCHLRAQVDNAERPSSPDFRMTGLPTNCRTSANDENAAARPWCVTVG